MKTNGRILTPHMPKNKKPYSCWSMACGFSTPFRPQSPTLYIKKKRKYLPFPQIVSPPLFSPDIWFPLHILVHCFFVRKLRTVSVAGIVLLKSYFFHEFYFVSLTNEYCCHHKSKTFVICRCIDIAVENINMISYWRLELCTCQEE